MPDTIRSLVELDALFGDNSVGAITPQDIRDLMVSMMVHGEIGSGPKAAITLGTGFQALDLTVSGAVGRGLTIDTINKWITDLPCDLKAIVHCEIAFRGAQNQNYEFAVFRNPTTTPEQQARLDRVFRPLAAADIQQHSWSTSLQLFAGDTVQMGVRANGQTFELLFAVLRIQRIGIE